MNGEKTRVQDFRSARHHQSAPYTEPGTVFGRARVSQLREVAWLPFLKPILHIPWYHVVSGQRVLQHFVCTILANCIWERLHSYTGRPIVAIWDEPYFADSFDEASIDATLETIWVLLSVSTSRCAGERIISLQPTVCDFIRVADRRVYKPPPHVH